MIIYIYSTHTNNHLFQIHNWANPRQNRWQLVTALLEESSNNHLEKDVMLGSKSRMFGTSGDGDKLFTTPLLLER